MYHYLSEPPPDADRYRRDLSVSPEMFRSHLEYLRDAGYTTISLRDLVHHLTRGRPLPPQPVVLTLDDGYRDNYANAFPLLQEFGMTATFFVLTDFTYQERPEYMTWDMLREMAAAGMEIASHGRDHADLSDRDLDFLVWQALGSREAIEHELGFHPRFISYPSGRYDDQTIKVFHSAGYWAGLTIHQGAEHSSEDLFRLKRVRIRGTHTADDLALLLSLDW